MKHSRQFDFRSTLPLLCLVLGLALSCPNLVLATTDLGPFGGPGGNSFRDECPQGSFLVGLNGRAGEWVDRIAPVCAPWLRDKQTFGAPSVGRSHGDSTGGVIRESACNGGSINNRAVQQWSISLLRSDNRLVKNIRMKCMSLAPPPYPPLVSYFGGLLLPEEKRPLGTPFGIRLPDQICPAGEAAVGIHGRAGLFLDAVGLICGPLPPKLPAAALKVNPQAIAPPQVQTSPLPSSSVMQAPAPSSSAPTQMRRIVPRGVDEKEASSESPAPTEPAKKP